LQEFRLKSQIIAKIVRKSAIQLSNKKSSSCSINLDPENQLWHWKSSCYCNGSYKV